MTNCHYLSERKRKLRKFSPYKKKPVREIMQEFEIIHSLFNTKAISEGDSNIEKVLEAVDLVNNSYQ
jgi:hypothetical protein